jgi:hypothetical protein
MHDRFGKVSDLGGREIVGVGPGEPIPHIGNKVLKKLREPKALLLTANIVEQQMSGL